MSTANILECGNNFYKLIKAKDTELSEEIVQYDGADSDLLDCYIIANDESNFSYISKDISQLGKVNLIKINTVLVIGSSFGETRCYKHENILAYKDDNNDVWMDAELEFEVFA